MLYVWLKSRVLRVSFDIDTGESPCLARPAFVPLNCKCEQRDLSLTWVPFHGRNANASAKTIIPCDAIHIITQKHHVQEDGKYFSASTKNSVKQARTRRNRLWHFRACLVWNITSRRNCYVFFWVSSAERNKKTRTGKQIEKVVM